MIDWLAVIVICSAGECVFWADTKTPFYSKEACERKVVEMSVYFSNQGIEPALSACLPLKFKKV
jgi:hypothetical protein